MRLIDRLRPSSPSARGISSLEEYIAAVSGQVYGPAVQQTLTDGRTVQAAPDTLRGHAGRFASNGVVFACIATRLSVFSGTRLAYQRLRQGRPSELFGDESLRILERPWTGGTTQDLLSRMLLDTDLAGNSYWRRDGNELTRLSPDRVDVVLERTETYGMRKVGYAYWPDGHRGDITQMVPLLLGEVAHFAPIPDPIAEYRGMSWLSPLIREVLADDLMTQHKRAFFNNGATPNMVIKHGAGATREQVERFQAMFDDTHTGVENAYRTLQIGGGADVTVVGKDLKELDFKIVQGAGETRIAAAAGVPPILVGLSEGLASGTYSNYGQARRRFGDGTLHPLWGNLAGSLQTLVPPPGGSRLWYDARDIPFLREDSKDAAEIAQKQATTMASLVQAGYTPESVQRAVGSGDFGLLEHSGLYSVQLQSPGAGEPVGHSTTTRELVEMVQKVYLGVGTVLTETEARELLNREGAGLVLGAGPTSTTEGTTDDGAA